MTEPDVALTDYAVALEGALFLGLLRREPAQRPELRPWLMLFFLSVSVASFCGGTVHGFFLEPQSLGSAILWPAALIAMGVTALSTWMLGANLLVSQRSARWVLLAAGVQFCLCSIAVYWTQEFWIAILNDVPAVVFLLVALGVVYQREKHPFLLLAAAGAALTLVAIVLQQLHFGIHPVYFDHNALYHVLQAIALGAFFWGARCLVGPQQAC